MNAVERQALVSLRVELTHRLKACAGCGGTGLLPSLRRCPLCRSAWKLLDSTEALLLPTCDPVDQVQA